MKKIRLTFRDALPSVEEMVSMANQDSDAASSFAIGSTLDDTVGAIIVIKGGEEFRRVRLMLVNAGMLTPGKPVVDPKGAA